MNRSDEWADRLDPAADDPDLPPADREALDRFAAALADEAVWSDPPPAFRDALLARAAAEGRTPTPTPESGIVPMPAPRFPDGGRRSRPSRSGPGSGSRRGAARAWWWSIGGLAAAAALVVVLAWPRPQPPLTLALSGTGLAPAATATAELKPTPAGLAIALHVQGLAPAPQGHYYAAWLSGPDGVVPVGTFHWRKGGVPINLWSGVLPDRYPVLFVTLQKEGSPPSPSAAVVLRGRAPSGSAPGTG